MVFTIVDCIPKCSIFNILYIVNVRISAFVKKGHVNSLFTSVHFMCVGYRVNVKLLWMFSE